MFEQLYKAQLLMSRDKYAEAEKLTMEVLAADPENATAKFLMSVCRSHQQDFKEAERFIKEAIGAEPGNDRFIFQLGIVYIQQDLYKKAEETIREAIQIAPYEADYWGQLSNIKLVQKDYNEALRLADEGLTLDPDNLVCLNMRSGALLKLNRRDDAFSTLENTLSKNPQNAMTYASYGWAELEKRDHKKALEFFRESLKLDPHSDYAKSGMVQAIKAKYLLYRWFLRYSFWMSRFNSKYQWALLIGFLVVSRVYMPLQLVYLAFVIFSWLVTPLSNLLLRLNPYGRYLLDKDEVRSSSFVGISLAISLLCFLTLLAYNADFILAGGLVFFVLMLPLSAIYRPTYRNGKLALQVYAATMLAVGIAAIISTALTGELLNTFMMIFGVGFVAHGWVANYFILRQK